MKQLGLQVQLLDSADWLAEGFPELYPVASPSHSDWVHPASSTEKATVLCVLWVLCYQRPAFLQHTLLCCSFRYAT